MKFKLLSQVAAVHDPRFAHTLHLVVKDSIKVHPDLLDTRQRCSVIAAFRHQKRLSFPEHKPIRSVETRWNSGLHMFESPLEQNDHDNSNLHVDEASLHKLWPIDLP